MDEGLAALEQAQQVANEAAQEAIAAAKDALQQAREAVEDTAQQAMEQAQSAVDDMQQQAQRSEEHTSELQSLMRISYAVFCLKKKNTLTKRQHQIQLRASRLKT